MTRTTLSALLLIFNCCGWPLLVHAAIVWITRRDWSSSSEQWSKLFSFLHKEDDQ